jgi:rubrerythrin
MDILSVLTKLAQLESEASKLYEGFSTLFTDDEKAREFFKKLSQDEQAHYDLVKYQERVVRKAPKDFGPVDVNMAAIERTLTRIVEFRGANPSLKDAIRFSLDVETEIAEQYAATIMDQSNKDMAAMMNGLTAGIKEDHYKQLIAFAASYVE